MSQIPYDIVDHILYFLRSDLYTLKQCAQSHPMLSKLSERHIYANVILCDDFHNVRDSLATSKFIKILSKRPIIAKHVRSLSVYVSSEQFVPKLATEHLCGVASLLPTFSGLNSLKLKAINGRFSWRELPCMFDQSFLVFLHRQGKKEVSIFGARYFPLSLLNISKDVTVTLDQCEDRQYDDESSTMDAYLEPFEHLSIIRCSKKCLESIIAWPRIHSLRSLEYKIGWPAEEPVNFLPKMVVACSRSLTNFCLDFSYHFENSPVYDQNAVHSPITLAGLHHLERLSVKAEILYFYGSSPIPNIVQLILTALATPSLKQIFLDFKFGGSSNLIQNRSGIWLPIVPLAATCSSLFIPVYISHNFSSLFPSTAVCGELTPYMEKGVVVMIPGIPAN